MNKKLNTAIAVGVSLLVVAFLFWGNTFMSFINPAPADISPNMDTNSGVTKEDLVAGSGEVASASDKVTVHYTGTLLDGTIFDSSRSRGAPFAFTLGAGEVIKGWDEGVAGMRVGGTRKLTIAPDFGYGDRAVGPIPANSILIFEVELLEVEKPQ
ncbi:MAG: FKBP-type peptidyl-prolyl cis-trans isomerase [Patescibacteria group bacterium]